MTTKQSIAFLIIAAAILVGGFFWLDLAGAQDRPGAITSAVNDTNAAGKVSISSREISIGTNTAHLANYTATAPSASTNSLPNTNLVWIAVSGTNVFVGKVNTSGTGTNWIKIVGSVF